MCCEALAPEQPDLHRNNLHGNDLHANDLHSEDPRRSPI
jgi:hypothetical protein